MYKYNALSVKIKKRYVKKQDAWLLFITSAKYTGFRNCFSDRFVEN